MVKIYIPDMPDHDQQDVEARLPLFHDGHGRQMAAYPCGVPGVSLTDYSTDPAGKGWGPHCTGPFGTATASNGVKVTVDNRIVQLVTILFNATLAGGYAIRQADTGAYNCRYIAGTTIWSNHAWGLAIDINWNTNPQKSPLTTDEPVWMRQLWNYYGFAWGGDYTGSTLPDAMHHEFMGTPAQAVTATNMAVANLGDGTHYNPANGPTQGGGGGGGTPGSAIDAHYNDPNLGLAAILGAPTTAETVCPDGVGHYRHYANNGSIYWTPSTGAWSIHGANRTLWSSLGWERSPLGYPVTDENGTPDGVGRYNHFQNGSIYWTPNTGAHSVVGALEDAWAAQGWERGSWGYPTAEAVVSGSTTTQAFQGGTASLTGGTVTFSGGGGTVTGQLPAAERSPVNGAMEVPGFDCSYSKPNPTAMRGAGYLFIVGYVSPTAGKNLSSAQYQAYRNAGLAVGLVWESTAGRAVTGGSAGGTADGQSANSQANGLGYPATAPIFFAVDQDTTSANYPAIQAYANAFNAATTRPVGIYGEADVVDHFVTPGVQPVRYGWQTVAWSGGRVSAKANLYQRSSHQAWPVPAGVASTDFDEDVALIYVPLAGW